MPKIWAYQPGAFRAGGGWDDVISLTASDNLTNLIAQLEESGLQGSVEKLALVFHGDAGGVVRSDPVMTQSSVFENPAVAGRVAQLRDYLTPHASVIFYCCMSGVGPEGSNFLKALSTSWPGRTVVGFVTSGSVFHRGRCVRCRCGHHRSRTAGNDQARRARPDHASKDGPARRHSQGGPGRGYHANAPARSDAGRSSGERFNAGAIGRRPFRANAAGPSASLMTWSRRL